MRESLEELRGAAIGEAGGPVDDEVLAQAPLVDPIAEHGERDPRIATDVPELALVGEGADDDLAILETDPGRADVGPAVAVERHERRDGRGFDERECLVGQEIGHRS